MPNVLVIREQIVESLSSALKMGWDGLDVVPGLLRRAIHEEAWKERRDYRLSGEIIPAFPSFRAFVEAKPPAGLGTKTDLIERILRDDKDTLVLFRRATVGKKGRPPAGQVNASNRSIKPQHGTTRAYVLDRLKRERPDLYKRVDAKKLSANAAAIEAGFWKRQTQLDVLRAAWAKASKQEREMFWQEING